MRQAKVGSETAGGGLPPVVLGLNAVILAVTAEVPRVLTVQRTGHALADPQEVAPAGGEPPDALPFGPFMALGGFAAVFVGQQIVDVVLAR